MENGEFNDIHFDGPTTRPGKYQGNLDAELAIAQAPEMVDKMAALKMLKEEKIYVAQPGPTPTYENVKDLKYSLSSTVSYSLNGKSNPEIIFLKLPQGQRQLIYCSQGVLEELIKEKSKESNCEICPDRKPSRSEVVCNELQQLLKTTGNKSAVEKLCKSKLNDIDLSGIIQKLNSIPTRRTQFLIDLEKSCSSIYSICYNIDKLSIGLIEAWNVMVDAANVGTLFAQDYQLLAKIKEIRSDEKKLAAFNYGTIGSFAQFLKTYNTVDCNTCGTHGAGSDPDIFGKLTEILNNTLTVYQKHQNTPNFLGFYRGEPFAKDSKNKRDGGQFMLRLMASDTRTNSVTNIDQKFNLLFPQVKGNYEFDMFSGDQTDNGLWFIECKSTDELPADMGQFSAYFSIIRNISNLEYIY